MGNCVQIKNMSKQEVAEYRDPFFEIRETLAERLKAYVVKNTGNVVFSSTTSSFWDVEKNRAMTGVHNIIKRHFRVLTSDQIDQHMKNNRIQRHDATGPAKRGRAIKYKGTVPRVPKDTRGCKHPGNKLEHGKTVDSEVETFCRCGGSRAKFLETIPDPDSCTIGIIDYLEKYRYSPLLCQVIVSDSNLNMASAVDLMCCDKDGQLVMIEIKATGHTSNRFYRETIGYFKEPLHELPFSYMNEDMLQLMLTHMMFTVSSQLPCPNAILLRATGDVAFEYPMAEWAWTREVRTVVWCHLKTIRMKKSQKKRENTDQVMENRAKRTKLWKPRQKKAVGLQLCDSVYDSAF